MAFFFQEWYEPTRLWKAMSRTQDSFNLLRKTLTKWLLNYPPGTTLELAAWTDACSVICKRTGLGYLQNPVLGLFKEKGQFWLVFSVSFILTDGTSSSFGKGNPFVGSKSLTPWNVTASCLRRVCFAPFFQRHTIVYITPIALRRFVLNRFETSPRRRRIIVCVDNCSSIKGVYRALWNNVKSPGVFQFYASRYSWIWKLPRLLEIAMLKFVLCTYRPFLSSLQSLFQSESPSVENISSKIRE